jgi:hypothetical protein
MTEDGSSEQPVLPAWEQATQELFGANTKAVLQVLRVMLRGQDTWGQGFKAVRAILIRAHQNRDRA